MVIKQCWVNIGAGRREEGGERDKREETKEGKTGRDRETRGRQEQRKFFVRKGPEGKEEKIEKRRKNKQPALSEQSIPDPILSVFYVKQTSGLSLFPDGKTGGLRKWGHLLKVASNSKSITGIPLQGVWLQSLCLQGEKGESERKPRARVLTLQRAGTHSEPMW